ncbi:hypothetical protein OBBRIDRAFT_824919 [Obba rivulosa]|uniref:Uncharacterized protein n=1 Tax=Obba rivulosa TaxID=1052685 RepID=A0A8E2AWY9_9APHY|nr:hypothetical protein OBBRIDRAFT_824919 [Obba rivulosa]
MTEVESATGKEDSVRDLFQVNFWGATHVTQAAVKFFREVNKPGVGGRLLQVSSIAGIEGIPALGFYNATMFALEGIGEALAKELGAVDSLPAYAKAPAAFVRSRISALAEMPSGADPRKAVEIFYRLADLPEPPLHFPIGKNAIELVRRKSVNLLKDTDAYASWSEGLEFTK